MSKQFEPINLGITELVASHARVRGNEVAVRCGSNTLTWRQLEADAEQIARRLRALHIQRGARVAVWMDACVDVIAAYLAVWKAGCTLVPLSTQQTPQATGSILNDCGAAALVHDDSYPEPAGHREGTLSVVSLGDPAGENSSPGDACSIIYTSGTTGKPKGVVHSHQARLAFALLRALLWRIGPGDRLLSSTPLYHNGGFLLILPALVTGASLTILPKFSVDEFCTMLRHERVTHTFVVPTQLVRLMGSDAFSKTSWPDLRVLCSGGAPMDDELRERVLGLLHDRFWELYGSTEGFGTNISGSEMRVKPGSTGRSYFGVDIRVLGDGMTEAAPGEIGEIVGRSSYMFSHYHGRADETQASAIEFEGSLYYRSGDLGYLDEDGYLFIRGRRKDMLITGGVNVYPADIEAILLSHPDVREASVVGIPDPEWGEVPAAVLCLAPNGAGAADAVQWANGQLGKTQRIKRFVEIDRLPRNDLEKVVKPELRKLFASQET